MKLLIRKICIAALLAFTAHCKNESAQDEDTVAGKRTGYFIVEESSGSTQATEGGNGDAYTVRLSSRPDSTVTIIATNPDEQVTLAPGTLSFTPQNWQMPQTITVNAVDDDLIEGLHNSQVKHKVLSGDSIYRFQAIADVNVTITDNDTAHVVVAETGGSTLVSENGLSDTYSIRLGKAPQQPVTISLMAAPSGQINFSPANLVFTQANWNVAQHITLTAVNDSAMEGAHSAQISHSASSNDPNYNGLAIAPLSVIIHDNDDKLFVTPSGNSANDCKSWANACTLTAALANAQAGMQIWVAHGTYKPGTNKSDHFALKTGVSLYGGFIGTESTLAERPVFNYDPQQPWAQSILSCDLNNNGLTDSPDCNTLLRGRNVQAVVIDGFRIVHAYASAGGGTGLDCAIDQECRNAGAGINLRGGNGITLQNLSIENNYSRIAGAGIYAEGLAGFQINKVRFLKNRSAPGADPFNPRGAALYMNDTHNAQISECTFSDNTIAAVTAVNGGAMYVHQSHNLRISHSFFERNIAQVLPDNNSSAYGGALAADASPGMVLLQNEWTGNRAESTPGNNIALAQGGAVYIAHNSNNYYIEGNFTSNLSLRAGGAIFANAAGTVAKSMFSGNRAVNNSWNTEGGAISHFANLQVLESVLSDNESESGGAISVGGGELSLSSTNFTHNKAQLRGGALRVKSGELKVTASNFAGNSVINQDCGGGAIFAEGPVSVIASRFETNSVQAGAGKGGGAIYMFTNANLTIHNSRFKSNRAASGGAIFAGFGCSSNPPIATGRVTLVNAYFEGNEATAGSGGAINIYNSNGVHEIFDSYFYQNRAVGTIATGGAISITTPQADMPATFGRFLRIANTTLVQNTAPYGAGVDSLGYNIIRVDDSIFRGNETTASLPADALTKHGGGGLNIRAAVSFHLRRTLLEQNKAPQAHGGALSLNGVNSVVIENSIFAYNEAYRGGALNTGCFVASGPTPKDIKSTIDGDSNAFYGNLSSMPGSAIHQSVMHQCANASNEITVQTANTVFFENSGEAWHEQNDSAFNKQVCQEGNLFDNNSRESSLCPAPAPYPIAINSGSIFADFMSSFWQPLFGGEAMDSDLQSGIVGLDFAGSNRKIGLKDKGPLEATGLAYDVRPLVVVEGSGVTYPLRLGFVPTENIRVQLTSSDPTRMVVTPAELTFTPDDYALPQLVTVTTMENCAFEGSSATVRVQQQVIGGGENIDGNMSFKLINIADNENLAAYCPQVSYVQVPDTTVTYLTESLPQVLVSNTGAQRTLNLYLPRMPVGTVIIAVTPHNLSLNGLTSQQEFTFTPANWHIPQDLNVGGPGSGGTAGVGRLTLSVTSDDLNYHGKSMPGQTVLVVSP